MSDGDEVTSTPTQISKMMLSLFILFIMVIGPTGFILPAPSKWHWPDCEWYEGAIVEKGTEDVACMGDTCYTEYYFEVQPDDNNESVKEVWVAPITYMTKDEGDRYEFAIC